MYWFLSVNMSRSNLLFTVFKSLLVSQSHLVVFLAILVINAIKVILLKCVVY